MTTATKPKPKAKTQKKRSEARPSLYERLKEGLDEARRHFAGEQTGVRVTVYPNPVTVTACVAELKQAREAAGLTLSQVSARCGLRVETLSRLELGKVPNPTVDTLAKYAAAVGRVLTLGSVPQAGA